jgi:tetratricopeptide (TPR) repeat protein
VLRHLDEAKLPADDPRVLGLRGHVAAIDARRSGNAERWIEAEEAYRKAAADPGIDAGVRNNLAVALHELGKPDKAALSWDRALSRAGDDQRDIVRLHQLVSGAAPPSFVALEPLTTVADEELALLALRWAVKVAPAADRGRMRRALKQAEVKARKTTLRPTLPPGAAGVLLKGNLSFNLGYDARDGLKLTVDVATTPWFVLVP